MAERRLGWLARESSALKVVVRRWRLRNCPKPGTFEDHHSSSDEQNGLQIREWKQRSWQDVSGKETIEHVSLGQPGK